MESFLHILLGLLGLSFIILIHELGHFAAAKCCKVHVERLCLFLGKPLLSWKWGHTEFAIAWLPLGGYCKMKGEGLPLQGLENSGGNLGQVDQTSLAGQALVEGAKSFAAASPLQKIFIAAAGPLINILFAFFVFFSFQLGGYPESRQSQRIVMPKTTTISRRQLPKSPSPAEQAALRSGDIIIRLGKQHIESFSDLQMAVALNAGVKLELDYLRQGQVRHTIIKPAATTEGRGWIGVLPWRDLILQSPIDIGAAGAEGKGPSLQPGMRLISVNAEPVAHWYQLLELLGKPVIAQQSQQVLPTEWLGPAGGTQQLGMTVEQLKNLNFTFAHPTWTRSPSLWHAAKQSVKKLQNLVYMQFKGLFQLLRGRLKLKDNLAGPIQISDQIGQVMLSAGNSAAERWYTTWQFLSFISFAIALANLLPIGVLDGGQILLYSIELSMRRSLPSKLIHVYQALGSILVISLMVFTLGFELLHYLRL